MGTFNSTNFGNLPWGYQNQPIPTLTGADLAYTAYRIAGILPEPGRGYSQSEAWDALKVLNSLIDSMLAERLMVWAYLRTQWVTTANKGEYTVGNTIVTAAAIAAAAYALEKYKADKSQQDEIKRMPSYFYWDVTRKARR